MAGFIVSSLPPQPTTRGRRLLRPAPFSAFTLIELLVVVSILSSLAAILLPVFASAREKARQTVCASNTRQVGMAVLLYAGDYDETLPGSDDDNAGLGLPLGWMDAAAPRNWARSVQPYVRNLAVFRCPSATWSEPRYPDWDAAHSVAVTAYLLNGMVAGRSLCVIPEAAGIIFLQESAFLTRAAQVRPQVIPGSVPPSARYPYHATYDNAHSGGANLLWCDGHVRWREKTTIRYDEFGLGGPACPPGQAVRPAAVPEDAAHPLSCALAF